MLPNKPTIGPFHRPVVTPEAVNVHLGLNLSFVGKVLAACCNHLNPVRVRNCITAAKTGGDLRYVSVFLPPAEADYGCVD